MHLLNVQHSEEHSKLISFFTEILGNVYRALHCTWIRRPKEEGVGYLKLFHFFTWLLQDFATITFLQYCYILLHNVMNSWVSFAQQLHMWLFTGIQFFCVYSQRLQLETSVERSCRFWTLQMACAWRKCVCDPPALPDMWKCLKSMNYSFIFCLLFLNL